jgi:hypothetical protein
MQGSGKQLCLLNTKLGFLLSGMINRRMVPSEKAHLYLTSPHLYQKPGIYSFP